MEIKNLVDKLGEQTEEFRRLQRVVCDAFFETNDFLRERARGKLQKKYSNLQSGQIVDGQILLSYGNNGIKEGFYFMGDVPAIYGHRHHYDFQFTD